MKDWFLALVVRFLLDQIASGGVDRLGKKVQAMIQAFLVSNKKTLIARWKAKAEATGNKVDDAAVAVLDRFLDALIVPSAPKALMSK